MELAVTLVALAACLSVFATGLPRARRKLVIGGAVGLAGLLGALVVLADLLPQPPTPPPAPVQVLRDGYVSSDRCRACHPSQYLSWHQSFHRTMTQPGSLESVAAPLTGEPINFWGQSYRLFERDGQVWADIPDPASPQSRQLRESTRIGDGPRVVRPVTLVTGSHHYQVYWVPSSDDPSTRELSAIPVVWRIAERQWIPRSAAFLMSPELSNRELPWALVCLKCHATGGRPGLDMQTDYVELGIACEACHGPAQAHVEHYQDPLRRYLAHLRGPSDAKIAEPAKLPGTRGSEVCAQCHSLLVIPDADAFIEHGTPYRPGDAIAEHFPDLVGGSKAEAARDPTFWPDGEIRVIGREWVAMTRSACHERGQLSCMDCHSMHEGSRDDQLHASRGTDAGCDRCHAREQYAGESHTHHAADSSGSSCLDCHMPRTNYGLLGAVRTHLISSPSVAVELDTGRPNACNLCHLDRTLSWTATQLSAWYGQAPVELTGLPASVADSVRLALAGDAGQRALMIDAMAWPPAQAVSGTDWMAPFLVLSLNDPYDAVRQIAYRSLQTLPGYEQLVYQPLAPAEQRIESIVDLVPEWFERHRGQIDAMPSSVPLDSTFGFDRDTLGALLSSRDNRPVFLSE